MLRLILPVWLFIFVAFAAKAEILVVAAPFEEYPTLALQIREGAAAALPDNWVIKQVDAGCTDQAVQGVSDLIIAEKPDAVIGLPCIESLNLALASLGPIDVPIITIGSRAGAPSKLAAQNSWQLYRTGPREHEEGAAIAKLIVEAWRGLPFAIIDDGTIFARDTAEAIRNEAETSGTKPVLVDGFQPQLESQQKLIARLVAAGATHVFIASDRANIAQIATEAANRGIIFAGPETLLAADLDFPLPAGVLLAARDLNLNVAASEKIEAIIKTPFALAEGYAADAFLAAEIATRLKTYTAGSSISTALGVVSIEPDGFIKPVNFALFRYNGFEFQKVTP